MYKLLQNELMKIFVRPRTYVLIAILLGIVILVTSLAYIYGNPNPNENWRARYQSEIQMMQQDFNSIPMQAQKDMIRDEIAKKQYALEHDIPPSVGTVWETVKDMSTLATVITIFTVIIVSDLVAGEFTWGTIKLLLIRPVSRSKILLAKYITALLFALILLIVLFLISFIMGMIYYGVEGVSLPYLYNTEDGVQESSYLWVSIETYAFKIVDIIMTVTIAFLISAVFRSSSLAIGISMFILFVVAPVSVQLLMQYKWAKYILFVHTDLSQYFMGQPLIEGMTLSFSLMMLVIYYVAFIAFTWSLFNKRDVAA